MNFRGSEWWCSGGCRMAPPERVLTETTGFIQISVKVLIEPRIRIERERLYYRDGLRMSVVEYLFEIQSITSLSPVHAKPRAHLTA